MIKGNTRVLGEIRGPFPAARGSAFRYQHAVFGPKGWVYTMGPTREASGEAALRYSTEIRAT